MTRQASLQKTGDGVLQTAIQMEEDGRDFYLAISAASENPRVRELCLRLANDESEHRKVFQKIRSCLAGRGKTVLLRADELAQARLSARQGILPDPQTVREMAVRGNARALFDLAIQVEENAVRFYLSFRDAVEAPDIVDAVIRQEQEHARLLRVARSTQGDGGQ